MRVGPLEVVHSWWTFRRAHWYWLPRLQRLDPRIAVGVSVEVWCFQWLIYEAEEP